MIIDYSLPRLPTSCVVPFGSGRLPSKRKNQKNLAAHAAIKYVSCSQVLRLRRAARECMRALIRSAVPIHAAARRVDRPVHARRWRGLECVRYGVSVDLQLDIPALRKVRPQRLDLDLFVLCDVLLLQQSPRPKKPPAAPLSSSGCMRL